MHTLIALPPNNCNSDFHSQLSRFMHRSMPPQSRGRAPVPPLRSFSLGVPTTPDEPTPRGPRTTGPFLETSSSFDGDIEKEDSESEEEEDDDSRYTLNNASSSSSSPSSSDSGDEHPANDSAIPSQPSFLHPSPSSSLITNAFAPPYYNRPPTPLPASPSLTSLLRPPFSTSTSRPTTPDSSENDTPNDTEAAVAKSARIATTVPRASPKVPTYEYYGFVLYLLSTGGFRAC